MTRSTTVVVVIGMTLSAALADGEVEALRSTDVATRMRAAHALGETRDRSAVAPLTSALVEDAYLPVASEAAWALGQIGTPEALAALEPVALGATPRRPLACAALVSAGTPEALELLERALFMDGPGTSEIIDLARQVLGRARSDALLERLQRGDRPLPRSIPADVRASIEALRSGSLVGEPAAAALLPGAAEHLLVAARADPRRAQLYLGWNTEGRGHFPAAVLLRARAADEPALVRVVALNQLKFVPDADLPVLVAALDGLDPETCSQVASRLIGSFDAQVDVLRRFAHGDGPEAARAMVCGHFVGHSRAKEVRVAARRFLGSPSAEVRGMGAYVLMATRAIDDEELAALTTLLEHETEERTIGNCRHAIAARLRVDVDRPDLLELARAARGRAPDEVSFLDVLARARPGARPPLQLEPAPVLIAPAGWTAWVAAASGARLVVRADERGAAAPLFVVEREAVVALPVSLSPFAQGVFEPEGAGSLEWIDRADDGASTLRRLDLATRAVTTVATVAPDALAFARPPASHVLLRRDGDAWRLVEPTRDGERVWLELPATGRGDPMMSPTRARDGAALVIGREVHYADLSAGTRERLLLSPEYAVALASPDGDAVLALGPRVKGAVLAGTDGGWVRFVSADLAWRGGGAPGATWLRDGKAIVLGARGELVVADREGRVERVPLPPEERGERSEARVVAVDGRRVLVSAGHGPWPAASAGTWLVDLGPVLARMAARPVPPPPWQGRPADRSTPEGAFWSWFRACLEAREADALACYTAETRADVQSHLGEVPERDRPRALRELAARLAPSGVEVTVDGDRASLSITWTDDVRAFDETTFSLVREGQRWSLGGDE